MNIKPAIVFLILAAGLALLGLSCKHKATEPHDTTFALTAEDASCTEAWLKLQLGADLTDRTVTLTRDSITLWTKAISDAQITILDTNLLPGHTYNYKAQTSGCLPSVAAVRTMDTTSHNFTWTTYTLGDGTGSSSLYDVAIINDTLAYAVGELYDGSSTSYCMSIWNGKEWQLKRLYYNSISFGSLMLIHSIMGILATSDSIMWLVPGSIFRWNCNDTVAQISFDRLTLQDQNASVIKLWGRSNDNIFGVGSAGTIVYSNGTSWQRLNSGTNTFINDVYGYLNDNNKNEVVFCAVSDFFQPLDNKILQINNLFSVDSIQWYQGKNVISLWTPDGSSLYVCSSSVYDNVKGYWREKSFGNYANQIRGIARNDICAVGDNGLIACFNGVNWTPYYPFPNGSYNAVCIKKGIIIAVGTTNDGKAIISIGKYY